MKLPKKTLERNLFKSGYRLIYATDEVGVGCLAGPVVACAVVMTNQFYKKTHNKLRWLRDSKMLQASQREFYAKQLLEEKDLVYAIASCTPKMIDKINIYNASRLAMKKAILKLNKELGIRNYGQNFKNHNSKFIIHNSKTIVLVDGRSKIPNLDIEQRAIVKGDRKVFAIACASIIAKVYRDKMMVRYAKKYPEYGFERHKGYGTKLHIKNLAINGASDIHRCSFAPVAVLIKNSKIPSTIAKLGTRRGKVQNSNERS